MKKIGIEVAQMDFERWLAFKKIKSKKREGNREQEETIVDAITHGSLIVEEDCSLKYKLDFPIKNEKGEETQKEFIFKPRIAVWELNAKLKGVKASDGDGRVVAYVSAITGVNGGIIRKLDTEDYNLCQAIVMYFL